MMAAVFRHRDYAPMRHFADHIFELDGGVVDVKLVPQAFLHVAQNALADRGGMSAMEMWQESARVSDPMFHTCRS